MKSHSWMHAYVANGIAEPLAKRTAETATFVCESLTRFFTVLAILLHVVSSLSLSFLNNYSNRFT